MTLFIHVGFAKCGSTSFQAAAAKAEGVCYPGAGRNGAEHIALPLAIKGVDSWTAQFISADWVEREQKNLFEEVRNASGNVILSSERLAGLKIDQIERLRELFPGDVKVVFFVRDRDAFLASLWRHAVYRHDYPDTLEVLTQRLDRFRFEGAIQLFGRVFEVETFNIDAPGFQERLGALLGCRLDIERENVGISMNAARLLQNAHAQMGTERFKSIFTKDLKARIAGATPAAEHPEIAEFTDPIF